MNKETYLQRLTSCYNKPVRQQLDKAFDVVDGAADPLEAWSRVIRSGLLTNNFADTKDRRYAEADEGKQLWPTDRPEEKSQPGSMEAVLAVAADPNGMSRAEQHARELARRLEPWGAACDGQVIWYFTDNLYEVSCLGHPYESAQNSVFLTLEKQGIDPHLFEPSKNESPLPILLRSALGAWEGWRVAVDHGFELSEPGWIDLSQWKGFSDLENPFEPLLDLWCTGYRMVCPFEKNDPKIRLYATPVR